MVVLKVLRFKKKVSELNLVTLKKEIKLPDEVLKAAQKLIQAGFKAYLAGGCVRDHLLFKEPKDYDIVTNAPPKTIEEIFPEHLSVGVQFGVYKLKNTKIDISYFRKDGDYHDHRKPESVSIGDEVSDTSRRDFTINALYYDIQASTILDYQNGLEDLNQRLIRAIGEPSFRFQEDALRILRAARFSSQLHFKIETETLKAMKDTAKLLKKISAERIREEIFKLFDTDKPLIGFEYLIKAHIWEALFDVHISHLPAEFRNIKYHKPPKTLAWLCGFFVYGYFGNPNKDLEKIIETLNHTLRLTNEEKKIFTHLGLLFLDKQEIEKKLDPLELIKIYESYKNEIEFAERFIRRARIIQAQKKEEILELLNQTARFVLKIRDINFPTAAQLLKEGFKEGKELGIELKKRQWEYFWGKKNF
jgi:tRNA nucleotidyltransferase/poly(A) polymerase